MTPPSSPPVGHPPLVVVDKGRGVVVVGVSDVLTVSGWTTVLDGSTDRVEAAVDCKVYHHHAKEQS